LAAIGSDNVTGLDGFIQPPAAAMNLPRILSLTTRGIAAQFAK
jgi:hypothetical protein